MITTHHGNRVTKAGYRVTKNGVPIKGFETEAIVKLKSEGQSIKENGMYYFLDRKQGNLYVYLP